MLWSEESLNALLEQPEQPLKEKKILPSGVLTLSKTNQQAPPTLTVPTQSFMQQALFRSCSSEEALHSTSPDISTQLQPMSVDEKSSENPSASAIVGRRVRPGGPSWIWGKQGDSGLGTVTKVDRDGWVQVRWNSGTCRVCIVVTLKAT